MDDITKEKVLNHVMIPLTANYGHPRETNPEAFRDLLIRTLSSFSPEALDRAVDHICMTRRYKSWPTIAEIVEAARSANGGGSEGKIRYPKALSGVTADNFWAQSSLFVERDFEARGTCTQYVRKGSIEWEAWAIYFDMLGLDMSLLKNNGWYAPTKWPSEFDLDIGLKCHPPLDFVEYDPEPEADKEWVATEEEKANINAMWIKLKETLLKQARSQAII